MSENPTVTIKGQVYEIPPLNTGQVKKDWPKYLAALSAAKDQGPEGLSTLICAHSEILLLALSNQYPHLTMEDVDLLSVTELDAAVEEVVESVVPPKARTPRKTGT